MNMEAKGFSSLSLHRRCSSPHANVASDIVTSLSKENGAYSKRRNSSPGTVTSKDTHTCQISRNSSMFQSTQGFQSTRFQTCSVQKHFAPFVARGRSMASLREHSDDASGYKYQTSVQIHPEKNEAEIIDDLPVNLRRGSYPGVRGTGRLRAVTASRPTFTSQWNGRVSVAAQVLDRQLNSVNRNSVDERRLQQTYSKLDRQSSSRALEIRQTLKEVVKDYRKLIQRSPSVNEWYLLQKSRAKLLQDREKKRITRLYSRQERHLKVPPHLRGVVSDIKWQAMMQAGLLDTAIEGTDDDTLVEQINSLTMSRRHTVCGENLEANLRHDSEGQHKVIAVPYCRRMTMSDIKVFQEALKQNADYVRKSRLGSSRLERRGAAAGEQNHIDGCNQD